MQKLEKMLDRLRELTLNFWLVVVYVIILLPAGFAFRILGHGLPPVETRRGWQKTNQCTSDRKLFENKF